MTKPLLFVVALALFDPRGRVLLAKRPQGKDMAGLWEYPGGKVKNNETPEAALCREIQEELALTLAQADLEPLSFVSYPYERFHLFMPLFACRRWLGTPTPQEGQEIIWSYSKDLASFSMPPADGPLTKAVQAYAARLDVCAFVG